MTIIYKREITGRSIRTLTAYSGLIIINGAEEKLLRQYIYNIINDNNNNNNIQINPQ